MRLYELQIDDENTDEVYAISFVENNAIESNFLFFNKDELQFAKVDSFQKMVIGPILLPNKNILRVDGEGEPYHVYFKPETVRKLAQNYLKNKYTDQHTLEHDKNIKGIHLVESWIKTGKLDKSNNFGLNLPEGSWVGIFQIENEEIWNDYIKTGKVKGFSIEALLEHKLVKASVETLNLEKDLDDLSEEEAVLLLQKIEQMFDSYTDYPQSATNNAKRALEWAKENGWGSCLEATGKMRANQLGNREAISRDTIARMASFKRHQQYKDVPYSDGCGGLAWDAWGGTSGVEWAINKLKEIDKEELELKEGVPHYTSDGKLYEGPMHKDAEGRLMTGEVHTADSEYLYHIEELEAVPSISSSYPGEVASGSIAPSLI